MVLLSIPFLISFLFALLLVAAFLRDQRRNGRSQPEVQQADPAPWSTVSVESMPAEFTAKSSVVQDIDLASS